jgi:hypothetical protein
VYENYVADMKRLMAQFSLKTEEEVVLGRAVVWHPLLNGDRFSLHSEKLGCASGSRCQNCAFILEERKVQIKPIKKFDLQFSIFR